MKTLLSMVLIVFASSATAQVLQVTSGEHDDFTRLVVQLKPNGEWEVRDGAAPFDKIIRMPGDGHSFDTKGVFSRIGRERLSDVAVVPGTKDLGLSFSCKCQIKTFVHLGKMLVIDISDAPGLEQETVEEKVQFDWWRQGNRTTPAEVYIPKNSETISNNEFAIVESNVIEKRSEQRGVDDGDQKAEILDSTDTEEKLKDVLLKFSNEGILTGANSASTPYEKVTKGRQLEDSEPSASSDVPERSSNLRFASESATGDLMLHESNCLGEVDLDISKWNDGTTFVQQLSTLKSRVSDSIEETMDKPAFDLAKFYLSYGLAAEAEAVLETLSGADRSELLSLAKAISGKSYGNSIFANKLGCSGAVSLWAALASSDKAASAEVNPKAIVDAFNALPKQLRSYLKPRVVEKLIIHNQDTYADKLLSSTGDDIADQDPRLELILADKEIAEKKFSSAEKTLRQLVDNSSPGISAQAVDRLVSLDPGSKANKDDNIATLASAYAAELRETEYGPDLWKAKIRTLIGAGRFEEAFDEIFIGGPNQSEDIEYLKREFVSGLIQDASDIKFLKFTVGGGDILNIEDAEGKLLEVSRRLESLGLIDEALRYANEAVKKNNSRDARILRSKMMLSRGQVEDALISIVGLQGDDVDIIYEEARKITDDRPNNNDVELSQRREANGGEAENWKISEWGDDGERRIEQPASNSSLMEVAASPSLKGISLSSQLILESEKTRENLRSVLDTTRLAPDDIANN